MNATGPSHAAEQAERKAMLENERKLRNTFHNRTAAEVAQDNQGRWAKETTITGSERAVHYPMLPSGSWLNDPVPPEPFIDGRDCGDW